ncbi:MAG: SDR family NAD(P)-dependent oxidoreductase [Candidatus Binataceae bacterium]
MSGRLEGKNALITGGASGIGRATALRFAQEGANVFLADRFPAGAEEAASEIQKLGRKAIVHQVDTADETAVGKMADAAVKAMGSIDISVAAAGVSHGSYGVAGGPQYHQPKIVAELDFAEWRKVMSINLDGVFLTCRAVAAAMIKARKGGRIINIASTAARIVEVGLSAYGVSKAGVWMLTRVMAAELAPYNITVNAIGPGLTKTPMTTNIIGDEDDPAAMRAALNRENQVAGNHLQRVLLNRFGEPLDVANTALFLASEEGSYFTGSILHPDGGIVLA